MKILSAIVLTAAVVGFGSASDARPSHHRQHMVHRERQSHTGATTSGSGGGVGTNGATQTGVNAYAGSGGAAGGLGR